MMEFRHLQSRMRRPVIIKAVPQGDVAALAAQGGITHIGGLDRLAAVARLPGG